MSIKKIIAILCFIGGIAMLLVAQSISSQLVEGKIKVASSQGQVDAGKGLFSHTPATKELGKVVTGSAQSQIDQGRRDIVKYEAIMLWLRIGGGLLLAAGAVLFFIKKKK